VDFDFAVTDSFLPTLTLLIVQEVFGALIVQPLVPFAETRVLETPAAGASIATTTLANFFLPLDFAGVSVTEAIAGATGFLALAVEIEAAFAGCVALAINAIDAMAIPVRSPVRFM
jgi:hypothetical protein